MNKKGVFFSSYIYVLLVFFLMALGMLLNVLNNTKLLSDKVKEGANTIVDDKKYNFSIDIIGNKTLCVNFGEAYNDPGFTTSSPDGEEVSVIVDSNLDIWKTGKYYVNYIGKYKNEEKSVKREVYVLKNDFSYTGSEQEFIAYCPGYYEVELWGARGNLGSTSSEVGRGGYTKGKLVLESPTNLYVYVGGGGATSPSGGWNGGGQSGTYGGQYGGGGGGATDIRLLNGSWNNIGSLKSRIMVAAGGGGSNSSALSQGHGGGLWGGNSRASGYESNGGNGAKTNSGGAVPTNFNGTAGLTGGSFGTGGNGNPSSASGQGAGGGGGYYGGSGGSGAGTGAWGGGGGSSFISGYAGVDAISISPNIVHTKNTLHYSNLYFVGGTMQTGMWSAAGKAKIKYLGTNIERTNTNLNSVRYVRDCTNGNSVNTGNHWVEIQVIHKGTNIALGVAATADFAEVSTHPFSRLTDGDLATANYTDGNGVGQRCVKLDLGTTYDVDEIAIWHYYADGRSYTFTTSVSSDNTNWRSVMINMGVESIEGHRVNAY